MPLYSCECCGFSSKIKTHYNRHLETFKHLREFNKILIDPVTITNDHKKSTKNHKKSQNDHKMITNQNLVINKETKHICIYCGHSFSSLSNKRRHEKYYCKKKNHEKTPKNHEKTPKNHEKIVKKLQKENLEFKKQINLLISKVGNTTNTTNTTNITNNIQLNNYGSEDLSHITDNYKTHLLKIPYAMIPKMIEAVHFNDKKPENKNIILANKKENKIKIFSNNKWIYKDKEDIITNLINGKYYLLEEHYDIKNLNIEKYINFKNEFDVDNKKIVAMMKKTCDLLLLNNR